MPVLRWNAPQYFWCYSDEKAFFTWLESITGVKRVKGVGADLFIYLRSSTITDKTLRDFIGIYTRYNGDLSQLAQFLTPKNQAWFKNPEMYWYRAVFNPPKRRKKAAA